MLSSTAIIWLVFALLGQFCLLFVLFTFWVAKTLPQRKNPFLINFILTTFLAQFPPTLLFITGYLNDNPPKYLCLAQNVLMDGIGPMFGIALVVLVFHTWVNLRAMFLGEIPITSKFPSLRAFLLLAPYTTMVFWCIASLAAATQSPSRLGLPRSSIAPIIRFLELERRFVGFFMLVFGVIEFLIEACIGRLIYIHLSGAAHKAHNKSYLISYHFALRVLVFCFLQVIPIILAALNSWFRLNSPTMKNATHILESTDALMTFLVFGTSTDLLQAWRLKGKSESTLKIHPEAGSAASANGHVHVPEPGERV